jgi:5-methylcytosine-specific restriction protein A
LIRLGDAKRGIVGSGRVLSKPQLDLHWDRNRAARGDQTMFVDILFDTLSKEPLIDWRTLKTAPFGGFNWGIQMSGVRVPDVIAAALEKRWRELKPRSEALIPEEVNQSNYWEGATQSITVNAYERDRVARALCIEHYGLSCVVCGFNFEEEYGMVAAGYIHVHHLVPLSQIGKKYRVDPVEDLRPVCANCHAVIHLRKKPYLPNEVTRFVEGGKNRSK